MITSEVEQRIERVKELASFPGYVVLDNSFLSALAFSLEYVSRSSTNRGVFISARLAAFRKDIELARGLADFLAGSEQILFAEETKKEYEGLTSGQLIYQRRFDRKVRKRKSKGRKGEFAGDHALSEFAVRGLGEEKRVLHDLISSRRGVVRAMTPIERYLPEQATQEKILGAVSKITERDGDIRRVLANKCYGLEGNRNNDRVIFAKCLGLGYRSDVALVTGDGDFTYLLGGAHVHRNWFWERGLEPRLNRINLFGYDPDGKVYQINAPMEERKVLVPSAS